MHAKLGEVLDAEETLNFLQRFANSAKPLIEALPERMIACLPEDTSAAALKIVRGDLDRVVADVLEGLAELAEGSDE